MASLMTIEDVYAEAGRPMRSPSRCGEGTVVRWQEFYVLRVERAWLKERELPEREMGLYRALPLKSRVAVRRVVDGVLVALWPHVAAFAPDKVARVRNYWQRALPECRWVELFHRLMDAEVLHLDRKSISGALRIEERAFRIRLLDARERWLRALYTPRVNVHELHAALTVASLVLLHAVERALQSHSPRHNTALE